MQGKTSESSLNTGTSVGSNIAAGQDMVIMAGEDINVIGSKLAAGVENKKISKEEFEEAQKLGQKAMLDLYEKKKIDLPNTLAIDTFKPDNKSSLPTAWQYSLHNNNTAYQQRWIDLPFFNIFADTPKK